MSESRNPEAERAALNGQIEQLAGERAERFPSVDAAMRSYEEALGAHQAFLKQLENSAKNLPSMRDYAIGKVRDWATNLIPGVRASKQFADWVRVNLGGSLKYSAAPYQPATFEQVRHGLVTVAELTAVAVELKVDEVLRVTERGLAAAEDRLQASLDELPLENALPLAELQQRIFELRAQISA